MNKSAAAKATILSALEQAVADGKPWVVFNNRVGGKPQYANLHFFSSSGEAGKFCDQANGPETFIDQSFNFDNYIYLSVTSMRYQLEPAVAIWPRQETLEPVAAGLLQVPFSTENYSDAYLTFKNSNMMNQSSYDYNRTQLLNLGFGEEIAQPLKQKMEQDLTSFTLEHVRKFGKDEVRSTLHFSKGDEKEKDLTFFNRFDATLRQEGKEDLTQTFFVGNKYNYTLQERYNMMDGRAAYREQPKMVKQADAGGEEKMRPTGETYFAWRGLDFKNADQYGNFNPKIMFWEHQKELVQYPVKGIEENYDLQRLLSRLEKGNKVDVVLLKDGQETQAQVQANPRMMRLDFYDSNGQALAVNKTEKQVVDQTQQAALTPQEVQRAAIARASSQQQEAPVQNAAAAAANIHSSQQQKNTQLSGENQSQKETTRQQVVEPQAQRRKPGVRI